ncbi:MAG: hypothetical protein GOP50_02700 [Candidatus Heimdallarchaeota archaeon]|nr:hypothetical protein [Candidatus Heimdallarchaeota archaeon]
MKRKGISLIIIIIFFLPILFHQGNSASNSTKATFERTGFELNQELITLEELNWSYGSYAGGVFAPVIDSDYIYDRTDTVLHVLEASGDLGNVAGWYTSFNTTEDSISLSFDMRVKAGHLTAVQSSFSIFDNVTKKRLHSIFCFGVNGYYEQDSLDPGYKSFNVTFFTNTTASLLIFFGVNDGFSADWNQEMWLTNLELNPSFNIDNLESVNYPQIIPFNNSSPRGLLWHNDRLLVAGGGGVTEYDPLTEEILKISPMSDNHRALTFDGTYFCSARAFWSGSYDDYELKKYDQDFNQVSVINLNLPRSVDVSGRAGVAYDGTYIWLAESQENEIYQLNKDTGAVISTIPAPGPRITGMDFDGTDLWVCDGMLNQIFRISTIDGSILETYDTDLGYLWGITIDSSKNIWIASAASTIIYKTNINTVSDIIAPIIDGPEDMFTEVGALGNHINWTLQDENPDNYTVYRNDVGLIFNTWINDQIVSVNVDYLVSGVYNYTIIAYDTSDNKATDTVILTVYIIASEYSPYIVGLITFVLVTVVILYKKKRRN